MNELKQFRPKIAWGVLAAGLVAIAILVSLGTWQLDRAAEKQTLIAKKSQQQEPIEYLHRTAPQALDAVALPGTLLPQPVFLLDNKIYQGEVGYEVLVLLQQDMDSRAILVNAGWVAAGPDRSQLPTVSIPSQSVTVTGRLTEITQGLTLAEDSWQRGWPKRIQQIDRARIEQLIDKPVYPWHVRLDKPLIDGLPVDWKVVNMSPQKHQAYALQWFSLAAALTIWLFWFLRLRRQ